MKHSHERNGLDGPGVRWDIGVRHDCTQWQVYQRHRRCGTVVVIVRIQVLQSDVEGSAVIVEVEDLDGHTQCNFERFQYITAACEVRVSGGAICIRSHLPPLGDQALFRIPRSTAVAEEDDFIGHRCIRNGCTDTSITQARHQRAQAKIVHHHEFVNGYMS